MTPKEIRSAALRWGLKKPLKTSVIRNHIFPDCTVEEARGILDGLVADGLATISKPRQVYIYELTEAGRMEASRC